MKIKYISIVLLFFVALPAWGQGFIQFKTGSDVSGTASAALNSTGAGNLIVNFAGTQLLAGSEGQASGTFLTATMSDGTTLTQCTQTGCDSATSDGYLDTRIWLGTEAGGTTPTFTNNTTIGGQTFGNLVYELSGVNAIDQISSKQYIGYGAGGGTIVSNTITTIHPNEVLLCLAQEAHPIAAGNHMVSIGGAGWTGDAFGNQGLAHQVVTSTGNYSCTINLGNGVGEDYSITIVGFYQAPANPNPRVQGTSCETGGGGGGAISTTCTLNSVVSGHALIAGANTNQPSTITISDNCGGTWTPYDGSSLNSSYIVQAVSSGSHGNCIVTFSATASFAITGVVEEITTGYSIHLHSIKNPGTTQTSITSNGVSVAALEYVFAWAVDQNGQDVALPTVGGSFTRNDTQSVFPIADGDETAAGAGTVSATWSAFQAASIPAAGIMTFTSGGGGGGGGPIVGATYYLSCASCSPAGNDFNTGIDAAHPWLTPNHPVNCGDVILAAASTAYSSGNFTSGNWGTVTCPANNNVAWLKCVTFDACKASCNGCGFFIDKSYWGVQGFEDTMPGPSFASSCFLVADNGGGVTVHHVIFANDIANGCGQTGFGATSGQGQSTDYVVFVGDIAYNAAQNGGTVCGQGLSIFGPKASDTVAGTHILIAGNFVFDNVDNASCNSSSPSDGEGLELDTYNLNSYAQQTVVENNIFIFNGGRGFEALLNNTGTVYVKQNTIYGNNTDSHQSTCGEIFFNGSAGTTNLSGNIAMTTASTCPQGATWFDYWLQNASTGVVTTTANYGRSAAGNNCFTTGGSVSCGSLTITTIDPAFASPANPPAPSCGSFASVPACMATVIANFTPSGGAATYGYQKPSGTSSPDPLFPQWLCNVNLPAGLVQMACPPAFTGPPSAPTKNTAIVVVLF